MTTNPIPEGQHSIAPYLGIKGAAKAIEFYKKAVDAVETFRLDGPDGRVGHAELKIGDSTLMLADPTDMEGGLTASQSLGGAAVAIHLYVEDSDKVCSQAVAASSTQVREVKDQFYGDRSAAVRDPFGNLWFVATHKEDLTSAEVRDRAAKLFG
ncbi:VOC family protein [Streptomyces sp. NPDC059447]|uniref:VOC family protein n=1 Tax=Streptomyces sp. NPDC059447 TaxID=3346834 RepID=UPI00367EFFBD